MATSYSDGGLIRGSLVASITDSGNANATVNYLFKTFSQEQPVRSSYEFDENGLPKASSHVRDFRKFSATIMAYANTNAPAQMAKFTANFGDGNANYVLLGLKRDGATEGLKSYAVEGVEVVN